MAATITRRQRRADAAAAAEAEAAKATAQAAEAEASAPVATPVVATKVDTVSPPSFTMQIGDARTFFSGHLLTVSTDMLLPIFTHIKIVVSGSEIEAWSTDRYRATHTSVLDNARGVAIKGAGEYLISGSALKAALATLTKVKREATHPVTFAIEDGKLHIATYDGSVTIPLYTDAEFPKVHHLFDKPTSETVAHMAFNPAILGDLCKFPRDRNTALVLRSVGPAKPALATWQVDDTVSYRHLIMQMRVPGLD